MHNSLGPLPGVSGPPLNPPIKFFWECILWSWFWTDSRRIRGICRETFGSGSDYVQSNGHWTRITEPVGGKLSYKPPVNDINAPDFIHSIYGICYLLGSCWHLIRFWLEALNWQFVKGMVGWFHQVVLLKISLLSLGGGETPLLDMIAYAGYSFTGISEQYPKDYNTNNGNPRRLTSTYSSSSSTTSVHVTALDGLVNVNSLFTITVFVGLSLTTPGQHSLENRAPCDADIDVAKKLLVFEVVSFSFFLFSSLVAQGLKLAINLLNSKDVDEAFRAHINLKVLRFGMMGSAVGSVLGCLFLMLSMVNVIEIRLGMLSCGSKSSAHTVAALVILVSSALLFYISTAVYAFLH
ncbi:hypothetical protein CRYUN_Cryun01aG0138400 [Craigia yunnanensis]